jgi:hypothetical protein
MTDRPRTEQPATSRAAKEPARGATLAVMAVVALSGVGLQDAARADDITLETGTEWPTADTPVLEVEAGGYTVSFPVPEWIDGARTFVDEIGDDNVTVDWFTGGALFGGGPSTWRDSLSVQNVDFERWYILATQGLDPLRGPCEALDVPAQGDDERDLRVCQAGPADGAWAGIGVIFYKTQIFTDDRAFVIAYKAATPPFVLADESTWPMSRDELIAMADRIDGLIVIAPAP